MVFSQSKVNGRLPVDTTLVFWGMCAGAFW